MVVTSKLELLGGMMKGYLVALASVAGVVLAGPAFADPISTGATVAYSVSGSASPYQIFGHSGAPGGGTATDAVMTTFSASGSNIFTFNASGLVNCCGSTPDTNPDGFITNIVVNAANGLSGLTGNSGVPLIGVFTSDNDPFGGTAPATLNFNANSPTSIAPLINQVFYIGDGHAGFNNLAGAALQFAAPNAATRLYLGVLDAGAFNGQPGYYGDNTGNYAVSVSLAAATPAVPEPASWAMLILGMGAVGYAMRRRQKVTARVSYVA